MSDPKNKMVKIIAITGVSRGLGRVLTEEFIALGHTVIGCARAETALQKLRQQFPSPNNFWLHNYSKLFII